MIARRIFLASLVSALAGTSLAFADGGQGGGDGGSDNSGSGGGDNGGSDGGDNGGSDGGGDDGGSDNSGPAGGSDGGSDNSGPGGGNNQGKGKDGQNKARDAVKGGSAAALRDVLRVIKAKYPGEVVSVSLHGGGANLSYRVKLFASDGRRLIIDADARTKRILKVSGL